MGNKKLLRIHQQFSMFTLWWRKKGPSGSSTSTSHSPCRRRSRTHHRSLIEPDLIPEKKTIISTDQRTACKIQLFLAISVTLVERETCSSEESSSSWRASTSSGWALRFLSTKKPAKVADRKINSTLRGHISLPQSPLPLR